MEEMDISYKINFAQFLEFSSDQYEVKKQIT